MTDKALKKFKAGVECELTIPTDGGQLASHGRKLIYIARTVECSLGVFMIEDVSSEPCRWIQIKRQFDDHHWPTKRGGFSLTVVKDKVFLFGGYFSETGNKTNELMAFDLHTMRWSTAEKLNEGPCPRLLHSTIAYFETIILFGGLGAKNSPMADMWQILIHESPKIWMTCTFRKIEARGRPPTAYGSVHHHDNVILAWEWTEKSLHMFDILASTWTKVDIDFGKIVFCIVRNNPNASKSNLTF